MKAKLKMLSLLLVGGMLSTSIAACSDNSNKEGSSEQPSATAPASTASGEASQETTKLDPVTLKVMLFGEKPADLNNVLAEFEKRTKDTLNTKLDISFDVADQYKSKMKLKMTAGEEVDMMFDAPWMNMTTNISQGYYQELDKYFNNDAYPGLKKAFPADFLEASKINGHIYAVPVTNAYADIDAVYLRKDLREKNGLQPVQSYEDLATYLQKVKASNPELTPISSGRYTFYRMFTDYKNKQTNYRAFPYNIGGTGAWFNIVLSEDGKKVLGATTIGDPDEAYASFPAPFNSPDFFYSHLDKSVEFNKYLQKDPLNAAEQITVANGKASSQEGNISGAAATLRDLKKIAPEGDIEPFIYNDAVRNMEPGAIPTDFKAWNYVVVPVTSKNPDRVMKYLDWLYSSQDNHDLFELGIEGEHWTKDGDKGYKTTDKTQNYVFPGYELTWSPSLSRVNSDNDETTLKYLDYQSKVESYYQMALSGFTFVSDSVKNEVAIVQPKFDEFNGQAMAGLIPNWKEKAVTLNNQLRKIGLEKIRAELLKQVQAYLDNGGK